MSDYRADRGQFPVSRRGAQVFYTLLGAAALFLLAIWLYGPSRMHGLYNDDLLLCEGRINTPASQFLWLFEPYENKYRPVFNAVFMAFWHLCGRSSDSMLGLLPVLNALLGVALYLVCQRLYQRRPLSIAIGAVFLLSRFAYFSVTQLFGIMEMLALFLGIALLLLTVDFVLHKRDGSFWCALVCYLLAMNTHERTMVYCVVLIAGACMRMSEKRIRPTKKHLVQALCVLAALVFQIVLRGLVLGKDAWIGTGEDTSVFSNFSLSMVLANAIKQIAYLFGWSARESYLSGYGFDQVPGYARVCACAFDVGVGLLLLLFFMDLILRREGRSDALRSLTLFLLFIGCAIGSSSVTIRVEMRWLYVSQAAMLLGIGLLVSRCLDSRKALLRRASAAVCACALLCSTVVECSYRQGWKNLYFWSEQRRDSSLIENTVLARDDLAARDLVIIDPGESLPLEFLRRQIAVAGTADGNYPRAVRSFASVYQLSPADRAGTLLAYRNRRFTDLTDLFSETDIRRVREGRLYPDGWATPNLEIEITPFVGGEYLLTFYTNQPISNAFSAEERLVRITVNGEEAASFTMTEELTSARIVLPLEKESEIRIETGYSSPAVSRDGQALSYVLTLSPQT